MRLLARATAGLWVWAIGFSLLYALHGVGCAWGWNVAPLLGGTAFGWTMVVLWLVLAAVAAATIRWAIGLSAGLERRLAVTSAVTGLVGVIVTGSPVVALSACR